LSELVIDGLKRCQVLNEENNTLINQRLKVVREANFIFKTEAGQASISLYDGLGRMVERSSRKSLTEV